MKPQAHWRAAAAVVAIVFSGGVAHAQATLLDLRFENSLLGQGGQAPIASTGVGFARGYAERGASFDATSDLRYASNGNILATEGTLEFWVRPTWSGNDGVTHSFLQWGSGGGGMVFMKDGAGNLRAIFNQFGPNGIPEMGVSRGVGAWAANRWHHVAYAWSNTAHELRMYVDGANETRVTLASNLPAIAAGDFRVGADDGPNQSLSTLDEVRVYGAARTIAQIAADYAADVARHPSLTLSFEGNCVGDDGETPGLTLGITYGAGVLGQCGMFASNSNLAFTTGGNIASGEGTLEFWVKPAWNGNDGQSHAFLGWGTGGGMLFAKDGAGNVRGIFSRFGVNGIPEMGVAFNVNDWQAGQWHHLAYTWSNASQALALYVDGTERDQRSIANNLPAITDSGFSIGHEAYGNRLVGSLDELRIYPFARTPEQILADFTGDIQVQSITVTPDAEDVFPSWRAWPTVYANTVLGQQVVLPASVEWASSDPSVVAVEAGPVLRAVAPGTAVLTATFLGHSDTMTMNVATPALGVDEPGAEPFLTEPAVGAVYDVPVLSIRYIPTSDGVNVDSSLTDYTGTVSGLLGWINAIEVETKFMLEEGSRFRGYASPGARPSMGYRVVRTVNVFEPLPPDRNFEHPTGTSGVYFPDYASILNRFDIQAMIEVEGVREVWLWGYHHGSIAPVESNMASPFTGDISNSNRFADDLPIFSHTYTLYNYNWARSSNESVHDHGHQFEALLSYVNQRQDGNTDLFWRSFVGQDQNGNFITGRCGWTHMPPNTTSDYDYENPAVAPSDIADWTPTGGTQQDVSADTWGSVPYAWPSGIPPAGLTEHTWYIYWMQSMPGLDNAIWNDIGHGRMTNWWAFVGAWDDTAPATGPALGLYHNQPSPVFLDQPPAQSVCEGQTVTLTALAGGRGVPAPILYQWRANGEWLGNGATGNGSEIAGAFSDTLVITNVQVPDGVEFTCVATAPTGSVVSDPAFVTVTTCCPADLDDGSGTGTPDNGVDINDLLYFLIVYEAGELPADLDDGSGTGAPDGGVDINDLLFFLEHYEAGC